MKEYLLKVPFSGLAYAYIYADTEEEARRALPNYLDDASGEDLEIYSLWPSASFDEATIIKINVLKDE